MPSRGTISTSVSTNSATARADRPVPRMRRAPSVSARRVLAIGPAVDSLRDVGRSGLSTSAQPARSSRDPARATAHRRRARASNRAPRATGRRRSAVAASACSWLAGRREHRHQRQRDDQREQQRERDRQRLVPEQLAGDAGDEHHREEHRDGGQRRGGDGRATSRGAEPRGLDGGRRPCSCVAHDALEHDDRVVDQHADRERDAAQRHDVERQVERVHQHERAEHRDRDRDAGDQGGARIAQEQVQHQDREQAADQRGALAPR